MGSKTSQHVVRYHRKDVKNVQSSFVEDKMDSECEKFQPHTATILVSSNSKNYRYKNRFYKFVQNKESKNDATAEDEMESEEFLGEGTNKTLFPKRHRLQTVPSGEWVISYSICIHYKSSVMD